MSLNESNTISGQDQVESQAGDKYKYGFVTDIEADTAPKGPERGHHPLHLRQEGGAGLAARLAAEGLSHVAGDGGA